MSSNRTDDNLHVALVEPDIPWNTGNVGRTALAVGARLHLVHPLGFDLDERAVRRAGLDYWRHVDLQEWPEWSTFEATLPSFDHVWMFSAEASTSFWDVEMSGRVALIFGSETTGLRPEIRSTHADRLVHIPMTDHPAIRSLNLSTAAALAMYEFRRRVQP